MTTTDETNRAANGMMPVHPGEILSEEMEERGLSANALAEALGVPAGRVTAIVNGQRDVTQDTARRLSRTLGTSSEFWLNLQRTWGLRRAEIRTGKGRRRAIRPAG